MTIPVYDTHSLMWGRFKVNKPFSTKSGEVHEQSIVRIKIRRVTCEVHKNCPIFKSYFIWTRFLRKSGRPSCGFFHKAVSIVENRAQKAGNKYADTEKRVQNQLFCGLDTFLKHFPGILTSDKKRLLSQSLFRIIRARRGKGDKEFEKFY